METSRLARKVLRYLQPYRALFVLGAAQVLFTALLELAKPWPLKLLVDNVLGARPLSWPLLGGLAPGALLALACLALVVIQALLGTLGVTTHYTTVRVGQSMVNDVRGELHAHLHRLSLAFHSRRQVGELLYRLTADTFALQTLATNGFFTVFTSVVMLGGMVAVMLSLDWRLTLVALGVVPGLFLAVEAARRRTEPLADEARAKESTLWALAQRTIGAIRVVQVFATEDDEHRRFVSSSSESLAARLRLYTLQAAYGALVNVVLAAGTAAVFWVGARSVLAGRLTLGELLVFISYLATLYGPVNSLAQAFGLLADARAGARRVFELLETAPDLRDGTRALGRSRGEVVLEDVHFAYDEGRPVLRGVSVRAPPGTVVALVGATGAGKTTLVSLIPRLYDAGRGRVLLDGMDVRELRLRDVRRQVAMVLQPPLIFPTTVRENIVYGRPGASLAEVEAAAHAAQLDDLLARLPRGLDEEVGEAGATLSSGEQLRITLARAVLRDAPILLLDEPTATLDAATEARLMAAFERLMAGRTTFIIAHRLSTVRRAGVILVLEHGRIIERGSFEELRARGGRFAQLHRAQVGGVWEDERATS